jgi:CheY-like chemotaxis protein
MMHDSWLPSTVVENVRTSPGVQRPGIACLREIDAMDSGRFPVGAPRAAEGRTRILVIEDDATSDGAITRSLAQVYDVIVANDPMVSIPRGTRVDAIVTNVWTRNLDSTAMVQQLREAMAPATLPVLFVGDKASASEPREGRSPTSYRFHSLDLAWLHDDLRWMLECQNGAAAGNQ